MIKILGVYFNSKKSAFDAAILESLRNIKEILGEYIKQETVQRF